MEDAARKRIRFINSEYETLFFIDDGGEIEIRIDGVWQKAGCRYIDEYHAEIGRNVYHICEFAEKREQFGQPCRPVSKTAGYPVLVLETVNAFIDPACRKKIRKETAEEYRAAAACLRRKLKGKDGESKTAYLNTFLDGYFYALKLEAAKDA